MNNLDKQMNYLLEKVENTSIQDLNREIKEKYQHIPIETRKSIEDFFRQFPYWGTLDSETKDYNEIEEVVKILKSNTKDFRGFYQELQDYRSKKTLYAILNNWYCYDFITLSSVMEKTFYHYFDLDIIPYCKNETFVDVGAYIGDTIEELLNTYNIESFKKIYAYEMSNESVKVLKEKNKNLPNIYIIEKGVSDEVGKGEILKNTASASANVLQIGEGNTLITTLDEDIKEVITMIKMDIEGSEKKAILGAKHHIQTEKPKLMISIYHGFKDVIEIWKLIKELNKDYKFFLRYYGGPIFPTEIVLYAI